MSSKLEAVFQIMGWDETPYMEAKGDVKQSHVKVSQNYSGSIEGNSQTQYLMSYQSAIIAKFVGFETLTATIDGKQGSIILQHDGTFESGVASSKFSIVDQSGKGELANISGHGHFKSGENGQADFVLKID